MNIWQAVVGGFIMALSILFILRPQTTLITNPKKDIQELKKKINVSSGYKIIVQLVWLMLFVIGLYITYTAY